MVEKCALTLYLEGKGHSVSKLRNLIIITHIITLAMPLSNLLSPSDPPPSSRSLMDPQGVCFKIFVWRRCLGDRVSSPFPELLHGTGFRIALVYGL